MGPYRHIITVQRLPCGTLLALDILWVWINQNAPRQPRTEQFHCPKSLCAPHASLPSPTADKHGPFHCPHSFAFPMSRGWSYTAHSLFILAARTSRCTFKVPVFFCGLRAKPPFECQIHPHWVGQVRPSSPILVDLTTRQSRSTEGQGSWPALQCHSQATPPNKGTRAPPTTDPAWLFPGNSGPKIRFSQGRGSVSRTRHSQEIHGRRRGGEAVPARHSCQGERALFFYFVLVFPPGSGFPCLTMAPTLSHTSGILPTSLSPGSRHAPAPLPSPPESMLLGPASLPHLHVPC